MWGLVLGGIPHTYRIHTRDGLTEAKWAFRPNDGQNRRISEGGRPSDYAVRQRRPDFGGNPGSSARMWGQSLPLRPCVSNRTQTDRPSCRDWPQASRLRKGSLPNTRRLLFVMPRAHGNLGRFQSVGIPFSGKGVSRAQSGEVVGRAVLLCGHVCQPVPQLRMNGIASGAHARKGEAKRRGAPYGGEFVRRRGSCNRTTEEFASGCFPPASGHCRLG